MATLKTGQITDYENQGTEFSVSYQDTDGTEVRGTGYIPNFKKWHGYYRQIPELRAVINKLASWTFGRGIQADKKNKDKLDKIKGSGKDSARSVLKNVWRCSLICGDGFAHIIKDKQGRITNLKPLNPDKIMILANEKGIIIGYYYYTTNKIYSEDKIYHLSYERIADEIHGIPFVEALEELIISRNEAIADLRILYHRTIKPIQFFEVETDDTTKLNSIEATINDAYKKSENIVIPSGVVKEIKNSSIPQYGSLDSLNYIKFLVRQFVTACGVPEVVMGWGSETTEASSKIIYLAFQQEIEDMQLYNQEQSLGQLNIEINLEFPASIETELKNDEKKDAGQIKEMNTNPEKDG
jgi:hypothetical protein